MSLEVSGFERLGGCGNAEAYRHNEVPLLFAVRHAKLEPEQLKCLLELLLQEAERLHKGNTTIGEGDKIVVLTVIEGDFYKSFVPALSDVARPFYPELGKYFGGIIASTDSVAAKAYLNIARTALEKRYKGRAVQIRLFKGVHFAQALEYALELTRRK